MTLVQSSESLINDARFSKLLQKEVGTLEDFEERELRLNSFAKARLMRRAKDEDDGGTDED